MTVIVDNREPKTIREKILARIDDAREGMLLYGDIEIFGDSERRIILERKNIFDLFSSVDTGRLWTQLSGIEKYEGYRKVLLIEGNIAQVMKKRKSVNLARYIGIKTSIIYGWKDISIVETRNMEETVWLIVKLNKKVGNNTHNEIGMGRKIKKVGRSGNKEMIDMLTAVNGIGEKRADMILRKYGALVEIVKKTKEELDRDFGLVGKRLYEIFRRKYKSE